MKKINKLTIYLAILLLLMHLVPAQASANEDLLSNSDEIQEVTLLSLEEETPITLFEDEKEDRVLAEIPGDTVVGLLEIGEEYSMIRYIDETDEEKPQEMTGFVYSISIKDFDEVKANIEAEKLVENPESDLPAENEEITEADSVGNTEQSEENLAENSDASIEEEIDVIAEEEETAAEATEEESVTTEEEAVTTEEEVTTEEVVTTEEETATEEVEEPATFKAATFSMRSMSVQSAPETLEGLAMKQPTNVYSSESTNASVLKSYNQGHILKFTAHNASWFKATVYINGSPKSGYIHANDVSVLKEGNRLSGFANVDTLNVYETESANSKVLKSYGHGSALIFRTHSSKWFKATVYVDGKARTGYIQMSDISFNKPAEKVVAEPIKGVAIASQVHVYSSASRNAASLKSYSQGHILIYRPYNSTWHQATVYVNGKATAGYIHTADVENAVPLQNTLNGVSMQNSTAVYSKATTSSAVLKNYSMGRILKFKTFTSGWYEATVLISGKATTGYINKNDIEEITQQPQRVKGVGVKSPTKVYASATANSRVLKSYSQYSGLTYKTFTASWYEATVYVGGTPTTGYIHKDDVVKTNDKVIVLDAGHGGKDPGAVASGLVEKTLNLDIALRAEKLLKGAGYTVVMTRSSDIYLTLDERSQISNKANADLFVSIHGNKFNGNAKGIESFWYGKYQPANSERLAHLLQNNLIAMMGLSYRRVAEGNYHVIRETKAPSSLVEVGFLDYPSDAAKLKLDKYRQYAAQGIFAGIVDYYK